jgi:hypothetical protein
VIDWTSSGMALDVGIVVVEKVKVREEYVL